MDEITKTPLHLQGLNQEQLQAVECLDGPLLVLAGAGTGKTRVLTSRLAHLLHENKAYPSQILAVTFTNKAAKEMLGRVQVATNSSTEGWWVGTFHSVAARILRRHAELVGIKSNFTIMNTDEQLRIIKQLLQDEGIDTETVPPKNVQSAIDGWKNDCLSPKDISSSELSRFYNGELLLRIYERYQQRLQELSACDFGDLLLHNLSIFKGNGEVLSTYQQKFRYILVDEYQDTNLAQYMWLRLLTQKQHNICCVGDDDQSIYGWRGAEIGNILRFDRDFPGAKVVRLEQNYRSTGHILGCASGVISHNKNRLGKTLKTSSGLGEKVKVLAVKDSEEETRWISDEIESLQKTGMSPREMAILIRAGFQSRPFEERFMLTGTPYRVIGGLRFYERQEIRDAIAYLRVVAESSDDLAFERIINTPKRGLGSSTLLNLRQTAKTKGASLFDTALDMINGKELRPSARGKLSLLMQKISEWHAKMSTTPHPKLLTCILEESGYMNMWRNDKSLDAPARLENLKELVSAIGKFGSIGEFLEHVSLVMDSYEDSYLEAINIMTIHSAKGMEFNAVFLPGWEKGIFPSQPALLEESQHGLEEERRLAYVAITRAKKRAYILHAARRMIYGSWTQSSPSNFIEELPKEHITAESTLSSHSGFSDTDLWESDRWAGLRDSRKYHHMAIDNECDYEETDKFKVGQRVFHNKFGYGYITEIDQDKLSVSFDSAGRKKILSSFVRAVIT